MGDPNKQAAEQFLHQYYQLFDNIQTRSQLEVLYRDQSMLAFQGDHVRGKQAILSKFQGLTSLSNIQRQVDSSCIDVQPTMEGALLVLVNGDLYLDGDTSKPLKFAHVFHLISEAGGIWVFNEIFRLNM